ncbi:MAG: RluA family pseudouridine synthase [Balneolia bacterium]|nr:RluA family pseudouridine synthase [Balneolia bacterium]
MQPETEIEILYNDADLIVLNKPVGVQVESDPFGTPNLEDFVRERCGREIRIKKGPGIVHRLDKPTSGVVVIAKKPSILKQLNNDFANRRVEKRYTAVVEGTPEPDSGTLRHHLTKNDELRKSEASEQAVPGSKEAVLSYEIVKRRDKTAVLEIVLQTGRYHQIRAQLSHIGHPILGDTHYGAADIQHTQDSQIRLHLHAHLLRFTHPKTGKEMVITSPAPF